MTIEANTVLSEEAVARIEARALEVKELVGVGQFGEDMLALCATVKALRADVEDLAQRLMESADRRGELLVAHTALQRRLSEVERERDQLRTELAARRQKRGTGCGCVEQ